MEKFLRWKWSRTISFRLGHLPAALALLALAPGPIRAGLPRSESERFVTINEVQLQDSLVETLETRYSVRIADGRYWYDKASGAWGVEGGPTLGFILPGLDVGGPLRA